MSIIVLNCHKNIWSLKWKVSFSLLILIWNNKFYFIILQWQLIVITSVSKYRANQANLVEFCFSFVHRLYKSVREFVTFKMRLSLFISICTQFYLINCYIIDPGPVVKATIGMYANKKKMKKNCKLKYISLRYKFKIWGN